MIVAVSLSLGVCLSVYLSAVGDGGLRRTGGADWSSSAQHTSQAEKAEEPRRPRARPLTLCLLSGLHSDSNSNV